MLRRMTMEVLTYRNKIRELIAILMESPFYWEVALGERHILIKRIIGEYHFLTKQ
jgi:hypothetical protein